MSLWEFLSLLSHIGQTNDAYVITVVRDSEDRSMNTKIKTAIRTGCAALALLAFGALAPSAEAATARREANGAIRYYDDNGYDRGYAWCLKRSTRQFGGWSDCSYFSYAQRRSRR
jgi:hypothetical protein